MTKTKKTMTKRKHFAFIFKHPLFSLDTEAEEEEEEEEEIKRRTRRRGRRIKKTNAEFKKESVEERWY